MTSYASITRLSDTSSTLRVNNEWGLALDAGIQHAAGERHTEAEATLARRGYTVTGPWTPVDGPAASWSAPAIVTQVDLSCGECDRRLITEEPGHVACGNKQCPDFGMGKEIWMAQRRRVERGKDSPAPGPGWPRPILGEGPHPYVTPVSNGKPWWRLTDGDRLLACQNEWRCQLCGQHLDARAWIVLDGTRVVTNAALHRRCLDLAAAVCPHLAATESYRHAEIVRDDLLGDDRPLPVRGAPWWQTWTVRDARIHTALGTASAPAGSLMAGEGDFG